MIIIQANTYLNACGIASLPNKNKYVGWQILPATETQKKQLRDLGLGYSFVKYQGQADFLFNMVMIRRAAGMASPKQIAILVEQGYPINKIGKLSARAASRVINNRKG